jgi:uncharacterized membrane protein YhaH (DUF805 family)
MWHFLFTFNGRLSRASFCLFAAAAFFLLLVLLSALYFYEISAGNYENGGPVPWPASPLGIVGTALWFLCLLAILGSALSVSAKRLHDRDKAAWWLVVFVVLPNALYSLAQYFEDHGQSDSPALTLAPQIIAIGLFLWAFVELACLRGTAGPNRFGAAPSRRTDQADHTV